MLLAWVGIYNSLGNWIAVNFPDYYEGLYANIVIFFLGLKLVVFTQTWCVTPPTPPVYCHSASLFVHAMFVGWQAIMLH